MVLHTRWPPRSRCHSQSSTLLFNHLVGALRQRLRDFQAERLRGVEVDDQLELGGLLDRQLARFRALEDLVHIDRGAPEEITVIRAVAHETASLHGLLQPGHRRQPVRNRQLGHALSVGEEGR
jgi:hypothetical protein